MLQAVLSHLEKVSGPSNNGWYTALCPYHGEKKPSFRLNREGFKCMACGEKGGLRKLARKFSIAEGQQRRKEICSYDYRDENGELLFQVVRYEPKDFRQRRPDGKGGWIWNLDGVRRVLYQLPELLQSPQDQWVFVVEGEKAAKALREIGLVATCSPMGAGKWTADYALPLAGRKVAGLPDKDTPGAAHSHIVASSVATVATAVKLLDLPGLGQGQDVVDWLQTGNDSEELLRLVEAAPTWQPVGGSEVLEAIVSFIRRFLVLSPHQLDLITLWIAHTHAFGSSDATPYLSVRSPEMRSGKTRLLEILELLVARPWFTGRVTPAVLSRKVDTECPTLLLDESDAAFKGDKEYSETLRGILNTGYRKGGKASICVGQGANIQYRDLSTFCPKVIAGIGKLPDTVADRSIPISMHRRSSEEHVEKFRLRKVEPVAKPLQVELCVWLSSLSLNGVEPDIPSELDDRASDCLEPLFAIADAARGEWPKRARQAAIVLMTGEERSDESSGVLLLAGIRGIFDAEGVAQLASVDLVRFLVIIQEAPWGDLNGRPLDVRRLADLLKPYGIRPRSIREGDKTPKGYRLEDFHDAWDRYLPRRTAPISATPQHAAMSQIGDEVFDDPPQTASTRPVVADGSQAGARYDVAAVADRLPEPSNDPWDRFLEGADERTG